MLQSFQSNFSPEFAASRLGRLRAAMRKERVIGFLVPRSDAFGGETVAPCDERLAWLTGFDGSAGLAVVLQDRAAIFVDSRYEAQLKNQTDNNCFDRRPAGKKSMRDWIAQQGHASGDIGYDPWLLPRGFIDGLASKLHELDCRLRPCRNLIDHIWYDQPAPPQGQAFPYPEILAGESHESKRGRLAYQIGLQGFGVLILTNPASVCWLLNIRGSDIAFTPVVHAFAILHLDATVDLFVSRQKLGAGVTQHLGNDVRIHDQSDFSDELTSLNRRVLVDTKAPDRVVSCLEESGIDHEVRADPSMLPRAVKNPVQIRSISETHLTDATAMVRFLAWLDGSLKHEITEICAVRKLEELRKATGVLRDISFETICASGPNGAIIHYRVKEETNRKLGNGDLLLLDSGGQYLGGTTDITRTIAIGEPSLRLRRCATLVLKGLLRLSRAVWPEGKTATELDVLARADLWSEGLDYGHSTGHGVGQYLGVHEGPSLFGRQNNEPLRTGMVITIEPGFYETDEFGIRLENMAVVEEKFQPIKGKRERMLGFRSLTLVPFDKALILPEILTEPELSQIDAYHESVLKNIGPRCPPSDRNWLARACAPIRTRLATTLPQDLA